ncbi:MAG: hypothetical protein EOP45_19295, partial [Sphingobacteriaceae bacterium]
MRISIIGFVATVLMGVFANPLYHDFEPITDDKKQVLLELFDALFVPTSQVTSSDSTWTIRGDIERFFGPISRTGVDYIFAQLGCIRDADIGSMEQSMLQCKYNIADESVTKTYEHYCQIPPGLRRQLHNSKNIHTWLNIIVRKTSHTLQITKAFIADVK